MSGEALDSVEWDGLETAHSRRPIEDVPRTLRLLASAGARATEEDWCTLYSLVTPEGRETPSAAAVALPFVVALAADPDMGARVPLVELLVAMQAPALAGEDWTAARDLIEDPDPAVRRAALPLAAEGERLGDRWRRETDRTVRVALLLALGEAVAGEVEAVDEARAVLADVLRGDDPVLWVAAVHASAGCDPELPIRQMDRLVEVFSDPTLRPRFEEVWYTAAVEGSWTREDLVRSTAGLLARDPDAELSFAVRLIETAERTGDVALCREALDVAWRLLTERRSVEAALLPLAGRLLHDPDGAVRLRAANILAALGRSAEPYADRLAELLDDGAADEWFDGTVGVIARWALTRIGDPRGLPGLIDQLRAQAEEQGRGYVIGDPRRPEARDVLIPLRAQADALLPAICATLREGEAQGCANREFLEVLEAWGEDAVPALPDLLPLLADTRTSIQVLRILRAIGPGAASAGPALRSCRVLDAPGNHAVIAATAAHISEDRAAALRFFGDALLAAEEPGRAPVGELAAFGPAAARYAEHVRLVMENGTPWSRLSAASTLWSITGRAEPTLRVLEEYVQPVADGREGLGLFREALRVLISMGRTSPAIRRALLTVQRSDRRLATEGGYPMVLQDQELRDLIEQALGGAEH